MYLFENLNWNYDFIDNNICRVFVKFYIVMKSYHNQRCGQKLAAIAPQYKEKNVRIESGLLLTGRAIHDLLIWICPYQSRGKHWYYYAHQINETERCN